MIVMLSQRPITNINKKSCFVSFMTRSIKAKTLNSNNYFILILNCKISSYFEKIAR